MDEQLVRAFNSLCGRWDWLDHLMTVLDSGRPFYACSLLVLLTPLAFTHGEARQNWLATLIAVALAVVLATVAGRTVAGVFSPRPRPIQVLDLALPRGSNDLQAQRLLAGRPNTSLPSTHAILGSACGLSLLWRRLRLGLLLLAVGGTLMVTPVLYFGLHWPSDIVVSLALSACAAWGVAPRCGRFLWPAQLLERWMQRWPAGAFLSLTLAGVLLFWRATPRSGVMDALTQSVRWLVGT